MRTAAIGVWLALLLAGAADAAGTKTVKDWTAVCDNLGACAAYGFSAEGQDTDSYLKISREAGGAAAPVVLVVYDAANQQPAAAWTLEVDGRPITGLASVRSAGGDAGARTTLTGAAAAALIAALKEGRGLDISQGGKTLDSISLTGSAAILLWVDDQQGRVGTVTALARPGPKPASAVPPPSPPPIIRAAPPVDQSGLPQKAPRSLVKGIADCDPDRKPEDSDDVVARLAPGLVLWGPQCSMGAYNEVNVFFLGDEKARVVRRVVFPEAPGAGQASDDELINVDFDAKTQTLTSFSKARGLGDCGQQTDWVWTGKAFVLLGETVMPECRGVPLDDWAPLYVSKQR